MGIRVQIPAYTDRWMRGDRYGEVVKLVPPCKARGELCNKYRVRLDVSCTTITVIADDCTMVD